MIDCLQGGFHFSEASILRKLLFTFLIATFSCCLATTSFGNITLVPLASGLSQPVDIANPVIAENAQVPIFPNMTATLSGNEVIVTLTGFADNQRIKLTLPSVQASNGSTLVNITAAAGFLVGDVNRSNAVNASDLVAIKAHLNQTIELSNFRFDLNESGTVDAADVSAAKARSGQTLP